MTDIFNYTIFSNFFLLGFLILFLIGFCFELYRNLNQSKKFLIEREISNNYQKELLLKCNQLLQNLEKSNNQLKENQKAFIILQKEIDELNETIKVEEKEWTELWEHHHDTISKLEYWETKAKKLQKQLNYRKRKCKNNNIK